MIKSRSSRSSYGIGIVVSDSGDTGGGDKQALPSLPDPEKTVEVGEHVSGRGAKDGSSKLVGGQISWRKFSMSGQRSQPMSACPMWLISPKRAAMSIFPMF